MSKQPALHPSPGSSRAHAAPRLDLKICEGCGALWLRSHAPGTPAGVYCRHCAQRLASFPAPRGLRPGRRPRLARTSFTGSSLTCRQSLPAHLVPTAFAAAASTGGAR